MARITRIALDFALVTAKAVKPAIGTAWQYAKIEMAPPLTVAYFTGRGGRKIEELASKTANNLIAGLEAMVRDMEAERLRQIRLKEEAVKAAQEKLKEEARIAREKAEKAKLSSSKQLGKSKVTKKRAKKVDTKPKAKAKAKGKGKGKPKGGKKPKRGGKT
ncbi:PREDICTED: uncharacterized protein LOC106117091 [Papilio xuthus]|uniref:Uncharacterized protein LOC106117091 n=1 Tax=Papilio xuthus TaxID=66420 RepID=A0AAJ6Z781_PAPXU|nr:PREDICTED: uncharacterized protein LOC106117091 [Papilio xuthus]